MVRMRIATLAAGLMLLGAGWVSAANPPFGGDDSGFDPPNKSKLGKCEDGVAKASGKLVASLIKCHADVVGGKATDDEACEGAAIGKFTTKTKTTDCGSCTNLTTAAATIESIVDNNNNSVFCQANGTPFGGDDTGNVPADAPKGPQSKCAVGVGKAVGKLAAAIIKCHIARADGKTTDDAGEDACEDAAIAKFTAKTKTTGCDPCVNLTAIAGVVETNSDVGNGLAYCASSPSGAFVAE